MYWAVADVLNIMLRRTVTQKRVSCVNDDGSVKWVMREVTTLACPGSNLGLPECDRTVQPDQITKSSGANKRLQILNFSDESVMDQPRAENQNTEMRDDIPLDVTN